jgi:hypothetical protein
MGCGWFGHCGCAGLLIRAGGWQVSSPTKFQAAVNPLKKLCDCLPVTCMKN